MPQHLTDETVPRTIGDWREIMWDLANGFSQTESDLRPIVEFIDEYRKARVVLDKLADEAQANADHDEDAKTAYNRLESLLHYGDRAREAAIKTGLTERL